MLYLYTYFKDLKEKSSSNVQFLQITFYCTVFEYFFCFSTKLKTKKVPYYPNCYKFDPFKKDLVKLITSIEYRLHSNMQLSLISNYSINILSVGLFVELQAEPHYQFKSTTLASFFSCFAISVYNILLFKYNVKPCLKLF